MTYRQEAMKLAWSLEPLIRECTVFAKQQNFGKDDVLTINQLLQARWQEIQAFGDWQTDYESDEWAGYQPTNVWRGTTFDELRQGYFALKLHPLVIELQGAEPRVVPDGLAVALNDAVVVDETTNSKTALSQTPLPQIANDEVPAELLDELTGQQVKLLTYLWTTSHGVSWDNLPLDAFRGEDNRSDDAVKRALERLQQRLNEFYERFQVGIEINAETRRVKLEKPQRTNANK